MFNMEMLVLKRGKSPEVEGKRLPACLESLLVAASLSLESMRSKPI